MAQLTPDYEIGCKRILISNDYYPALNRSNVSVVDAPITRLTEKAVETTRGTVELDILVVCSGFEASELPIARRVVGRDGTGLDSRWSDGGRAFACTTVSGFPNLFVMLGPNTGLGAGSIIYMVETQIDYIRGALEYIAQHDAVIDISHDEECRYIDALDDRSAGTVWTAGGCSSWYVDSRSGRLSTLWPDFMSEFRAENGTFDPAFYTHG